MSVNVLIFSDVQTKGLRSSLYTRYAGPYRIATELRSHKYTVRVIEFFSHYSHKQLRAVVDKFVGKETLFVGFSTTFMNWPDYNKNRDLHSLGRKNDDLCSLIDYIKSKSSAKIVLGGAHSTKNYSKRVSERLDYRVEGVADKTVLRLAEALANGLEPTYRVERGLSRDGFLVDSRIIPEVEYDAFSSSSIVYAPEDNIQIDETVPMEVARGCVFKCKFCNYKLLGKKWDEWTRSSELIRAELIRNYEEYGVQHYWLPDDTINDSLEKVQYLHRIFTSLPFRIYWQSFGRLDLIWKFREQRDLILESGCTGLRFGIETFDKKAGAAIGKGLGEERIRETLSFCQEKWLGKVRIMGLFITGLPGETRESLYRTLEYINQPDSPINVAKFQALRLWNSTAVNFPQYKMLSQGSWVKDDGTDIKSYDEANAIAMDMDQKSTNLRFSIEKKRNMVAFNMVGTSYPRPEIDQTEGPSSCIKAVQKLNSSLADKLLLKALQ